MIKTKQITGILIGMTKSKKQELAIFLIIVGIASFFRLYQLNAFGIFPATIGILTVVGIYFLTKELFEWRIAAIASYLGAISFWYVSFSRIESAATLIPFILVYAFYFIWKGLKRGNQIYFFVAGIFGGLGFYTNSSYCVAPLIALLLFVNYWWYLKKDFGHSKYEDAKNKMLQGFVVLALTALAVAFPVILNFWQNAGDISLQAKISISSVLKTLAIFNFSDFPLLPWPIGIFFVIGFLNELVHWLRRKHGHFSTTHTLLMVWFFVMLIPGFLSAEEPDATLIIGAMPVVMILMARGIWWFFDKLNSWYKIHDPHSKHEAHAITALVLIVFLFSIGFMEFWRYFK